MYVIPAIDLRDAKCVRLVQGDYNRQIVYRNDPVKQAEEFSKAGAEWLHIIDLDGAKLGKPVNTDAISAIAGLGVFKIQVGGGLRDEESVRKVLDIGIERVIVGTKAVGDFEWFAQMTGKFRGKIALGLDARGSTVATHGWTQQAPQGLLEFAVQAARLPIAAIIYTDIARDGMMGGPNFERTKALVDAVDVPIVAAGGISRLEDIQKLAELGLEAVVVGRGLYEGTLDLAEAIKAAARAG